MKAGLETQHLLPHSAKCGLISLRMPSRSADTYLFIDGQYLRRRYTDAMQGAFRSDGKTDFGLITFVGYEEIDEIEKHLRHAGACRTRKSVESN
jgi:protein involved in sex pheromone biosynthesis